MLRTVSRHFAESATSSFQNYIAELPRNNIVIVTLTCCARVVGEIRAMISRRSGELRILHIVLANSEHPGIPAVSTSPPGGNLVDGSPPAASLFSIGLRVTKVPTMEPKFMKFAET